MPIYDFKCNKCGYKWKAFVVIHDAKSRCPNCNLPTEKSVSKKKKNY